MHVCSSVMRLFFSHYIVFFFFLVMVVGGNLWKAYMTNYHFIPVYMYIYIHMYLRTAKTQSTVNIWLLYADRHASAGKNIGTTELLARCIWWRWRETSSILLGL